MHPELSDLLRTAMRDAPPPRHDVHDAVLAGRRRRLRARVGMVLAAVVVAVAGAVFVVTAGAVASV